MPQSAKPTTDASADPTVGLHTPSIHLFPARLTEPRPLRMASFAKISQPKSTPHSSTVFASANASSVPIRTPSGQLPLRLYVRVCVDGTLAVTARAYEEQAAAVSLPLLLNKMGN